MGEDSRSHIIQIFYWHLNIIEIIKIHIMCYIIEMPKKIGLCYYHHYYDYMNLIRCIFKISFYYNFYILL